MTRWWKACALLFVHLMLSCTFHHPLPLWGFILQVEWPLFSCPTAGLQPVALLQSVEGEPAFPRTAPHSRHPRPWPQTFSLFQRLMAWALGCVSQGKGSRGRELLINDLHLNSWRMGVQEEENLVERDIAMDEDRRRDSRDRVLVSVGTCIPLTREVNMVHHRGWRPI